MRISRSLALIFALLPAWSTSLAEVVYVIASKDSPAITLTKEAVAKIYLGYPTFVEGKKLSAADYEVESSLHSHFRDKILEKDAFQLKKFWARLVFSGKATPPVSVSDEEAMIDAVQKSKALIGYDYDKKMTDKVKMLGSFDLQ